jgi:hypothetical protein
MPPCGRALATLAALMPLAGTGAGLSAQLATVRVEENFRAGPDEVVLAVLTPGTELAVLGRRGGWVEAELEGWVWIRSLQVTDRDGFELVVQPEDPPPAGENLRARPEGPVLARLQRGTLLMEEERIPGWIRVRRRGWVWSASVQVEEGAVRSAPSPPPSADPPADPERIAPEVMRTGARSVPILGSPDGDTLGTLGPGAELQVVDRRGSWVRVRVDGWAWMPDTTMAPAAAGGAEQGDAGGAPTPGAVATDPAAWRGRIVTWELQFISLERAESVRTDFFEGEPFLLTRAVGTSEGTFVYVALPPERLADGEGLTPLERITVVGRVRVGSSALTGSPILDLVELRRGRGG